LLINLFTSNVQAQTVPVGSGSYTTQLPPPDAAGRNVNPTGTPRLSGAATTKAVVSSDWWTGLLTFDNSNLYNYPMSLRAIGNGLIVSYTTPGLGADDTRQPMSGDQPVVVGVSGLTGVTPTVSDYSDWTVTASWSGAGHTLSTTIGMGMPFVYCTKGAADVASITVNMGTVSVQNEMILVTNSLGGANFAVYAPAGSSWTATGNTYTSTLSGKNYFSVAMLPQGAAASATATAFKQYAYVFPASTAVTWTYDNAASVSRSTFTVTADKKEGTGTTVLLGLLPHQWRHLAPASPPPGSYAYTTVRGVMKMLASNSFVVENKFKGVLSTVPNTAKNSSGFDPGALAAKIDQVKGESLQLWTDSYNDGLAMNKLIQVAKIADQQGNTAARDQIIATVKARLENWFKADGGENAFLFYYNSTWSTLIGYPAGYYSDANLNDHHFHYGYFISAAVAVEQFQPGWASQWGGMVNMLIKDAANWDKTDNKFPFLRNFCPYAGHSFATGLLNNEPHGNNQESSSEAMNFNASLIHWGTITGNNAIRDLGIFLYTTEQTAIDEYYFDTTNENFASTYAHPIASRVWGNGYDKGTFWTNDIAATYGIEMVPMTASSFYLGHNTAYVNTLWNEMKNTTGVLSNTPNPNLWYDVYWSYLALIDPVQAINLYNAYPGREIKNGESDANTYNWLHAFNGAGQVDASITANYPIAVVFNKSGVKTYVAHNYGASAITVIYSDGFSMTVPARTMKTNKDIDATAILSSSALQIPINGNVTLTANVGGTVTKVEFYNGTSLIGTKTAAPYTLTTGALPAGKPNFYVRVYNGANFNLSNVVRVFVGNQLPYSGTPAAIPGTVEAGNYDTFEGGVGQDVTYFDTDIANQAGGFRSPEYVDAGATAGEGNTIGWINNGEWLEYTVNVATAGIYNVTLRYTSGNTSGGGPFWFENAAGTKISPDITVAFNDANWTAYTNKVVNGINLSSGQQVIRVKVGNGGFNLGKMTFAFAGGSPPSATVTSPANGSVFSAPASITINASATDSDGTISKVEFYNGTTLLGTDTSSPYSYAWANVAAGSYSITAKATDNAGLTGTSSIINVTVSSNAAPSVSITSPTNGASFAAPASITINATASDTDGTVSKVEFFQGATKLGEDATSPYSINWSGVGAGTYSLTAIATDNQGATKTSSAVSITVTGNSAPSVSITSPSNGANFTAPASINITATASDTDGTISKVEFFNGATKLGEDLTSPYTFSWSSVAAGTYSLTAKATDNGGAATTSAAVNVTVTGSAVCSGNGPNAPGTSTPDYSWQAGNTANPTVTFIPGSPIAGCDFVILYVKIGAGGYAGYIMDAAGGNFTKSFTASNGNSISIYFTYRVGAGGPERNSSATPHSFVVGQCGGSSNIPPTVSITSPANGASFTAPANITINASASDADGTVSKVEFFNGATKLGEDLTSPYSFSWTGVTVGTYSLSAKSTDNAGTITTSSAISITVTAANNPPAVSISSPANGSTFTAPATITINATASDTDGTIGKVEFFNGATKLGEDVTSPYSFSWTNVAAGSYSITVKATDNANAVTASSAVNVTVNGSGACTGNGPIASGQTVPDYSYQISTSGTVNVKFNPGAPITGCDLVIFYYRIGVGGYAGFNMTPLSGSFTTSVSIASGSAIQFYFTYRRGAGGMESNSSATPHSYTVGSTCSGGASEGDQIIQSTEAPGFERTYNVYPNPATNSIKIDGSFTTVIEIRNMQGIVIKSGNVESDNIDVSDLLPGIYTIEITDQPEQKRIQRKLIKL
jgi:endo-1,3(4)-beta-glucanase